MGIATGFGAGNNSSISDTQKKAYSKLVETQLSNTSLISTVKDLIATTISHTLVNNTSNIQSIINLHNSINIVAGKNCPSMSGGYVVNNIKQNLNIDSTVATTKQITIISNITSLVNNNIDSNVSNITSDTNISTNKQKIGSTFQGIADDAIGVLTHAAGAIADVFSGSGACAGVSNSCNQSKTQIVDTAFESKYKLDNKFSLQDAVKSANSTSSDLTTNDITEILQQLFASNDLLVSNVCPNAINISNIQQNISVVTLMKSSVVNRLASNVASNYINKVQSIISNMNTHAIQTTNNTNKGDIADFGDAMACIIDAGSKGLSGAITSTGAAGSQLIDTTGEGASKLISSAGNAVGGTFSGFIGPLLIFLVVGLAVYFLVIKKKPDSKKLSSSVKSSTPLVESNDQSPPSYSESESTGNINLGETPIVSNKDDKVGGFHGILHKISDAINKSKS